MRSAVVVLLGLLIGCSCEEPSLAARGASPSGPPAAPTSTMEDGWSSALAPRCLPDAHRDDLRITCMSLRGDPELTDRVCRSAAHRATPEDVR